MDKGEAFKRGFTVDPGLNGSFVLGINEDMQCESCAGNSAYIGFSALGELMAFLDGEYRTVLQQKQEGAGSPLHDVVKSAAGGSTFTSNKTQDPEAS
ncbi:MAG: hypothetical protein K0U61_13665 [Alphaproteobacteria bacterium]|nr:hypothetical protein [Alphaproteobacteria bacterium]